VLTHLRVNNDKSLTNRKLVCIHGYPLPEAVRETAIAHSRYLKQAVVTMFKFRGEIKVKLRLYKNHHVETQTSLETLTVIQMSGQNYAPAALSP
jgi:hypothetical protein